jgi:hypothetical protein
MASMMIILPLSVPNVLISVPPAKSLEFALLALTLATETLQMNAFVIMAGLTME